ncbi:MAG: GNAT family N-acetyltransferase [Oligoflexia bacterium]|nr:GNAT family N-acetyltransferase [Oligoflexia bacterium]
MITLEVDQDLQAFLAAVTPPLEREPAIHSFLLSLADRMLASGKKAALLARGLDEGGRLVIAGIQTDAAYPLVVSKASPVDAKAFAELLSERLPSLIGVNGPVPVGEAFAEAWKEKKKCALQVGTNLRLFELTQVVPPRAPAGSWRQAGDGDLELIVRWVLEFVREAAPHDPIQPEEERRKSVLKGIEQKQYFLLEDGGEVACLVGSTRESSAGRWIAPVYTPPRLRGKGYASALVAAVSEHYVRTGRKCLLFTDLANPTSNSIYQKVGYRPLADFKHLRFV